MFWNLEFWRRLVAGGRPRGGDRVGRAIVLVLDGLEPELVDRYLEQGLLHYLALLSDLGTRGTLLESRQDIVESWAKVAANHARSVVLPAIPLIGPIGVNAICDADRDQQARLISALSRRSPEVITAVFDTPLQLSKLFGPSPKPDEQLILRDVYARMDEVVGKAFSFVDDVTVLLAVIPGQSLSEHSSTPGFFFSSRSVQPPGDAKPSIAQLVLSLLGSATPEV